MSEKMSHGDEVSKLIKNAHNDITRKKGKDYAPNVHEIQKWIDSYLESKNINEIEDLKGGLADNKTLIKIAKKHTTIGNRNVNEMVKLLKKQLSMGMKVEMEHTNNRKRAEEIAMDHLSENPNYYTKLKKVEATEATGSGSSGSYESPSFLAKSMSPKKWRGASKTQIPGGKFVTVKKKCKKFPYCNQGDINALSFSESKISKNILSNLSERYGISESMIKDILLSEFKKNKK